MTDPSIMADKLRIGIYGGAFNPIHNGHLHLLDTLYRAQTPFGGLDKLLIVPTANPPHKSAGDLIPATHRIAMIRLAVESLPCADKIEISTIELESREKSYTYTTLVKLKEIYPMGNSFCSLAPISFLTSKSGIGIRIF